MNQKSKVYSQVLIDYFVKKKERWINSLINRIILNGESFLLKEILEEVVKKIDQMNNIERGKLILAFLENEKFVKSALLKYFNKKKQITKIEIDPHLILGGKFVSDNYELDFSFKNILWKIFNF